MPKISKTAPKTMLVQKLLKKPGTLAITTLDIRIEESTAKGSCGVNGTEMVVNIWMEW